MPRPLTPFSKKSNPKMAKIYSTPGVYIEEKNAFSNSVVGVPTNVSAFIGYTKKNASDKKDLKLIPTRISFPPMPPPN